MVNAIIGRDTKIQRTRYNGPGNSKIFLRDRWLKFFSSKKKRLRELNWIDELRFPRRKNAYGTSNRSTNFFFLEEKTLTGAQMDRRTSFSSKKKHLRDFMEAIGLRIFGRKINHGPSKSAVGFVCLDEKLIMDPQKKRGGYLPLEWDA